MRSILDGYPGEPVLLGESVTANIEGLASVYGKNRDEIELPMNFLYGDQKKLDAPVFKKQVDDAQLHLGGQTPVFFFSSHDHVRQWSQFGDGTHNDDIAKLTAAMTLLQKGTALMYYGEELGMAATPKSELAGVPLGPKRPRADDRDGSRTPMQWTAEPKAGFTMGDPWLPVPASVKTYNAAAEQAQPDSILSWYTALLKLRHTALFQDGSYRPLQSGNPHVFAFARETTGGKGAVVVLNMSGSPQHVHATGFAGALKFQSVLLASPAALAPTAMSFTVAPFGTLVCSY